MFFLLENQITKGLVEKGICRDPNVKIRPQPGCKTEDMEVILRIKPDIIQDINYSFNGIRNGKTTKKRTKKVVQIIEKTNPNI